MEGTPNLCPNPACGVANRARRAQLPALRDRLAHRARHRPQRPVQDRSPPRHGRLRRRLPRQRYQGRKQARRHQGHDLRRSTGIRHPLRISSAARPRSCVPSKPSPSCRASSTLSSKARAPISCSNSSAARTCSSSWRPTATSRSRIDQVIEWSKSICDVLTAHAHAVAAAGPPRFEAGQHHVAGGPSLHQDDRLRHGPRPGTDRQGEDGCQNAASIPRVTRRRSKSSANRSRGATCSPSPGRCIIWPPARRRRGSTPPASWRSQLSDPASPIPADQRWFFELVKLNLAEDVNDRYFSAREIKADLLNRRVTTEIACPKCQQIEQGTRAVLLQVRRAADRSDAAVLPLRQDQPHGQPLLHPLRKSSPINRVLSSEF